MRTYIALLRGLGGKYTLPMQGLAEIMLELGLRDVRTYIQSGNAIFRSDRASTGEIAEEISSAINERYGFAPRVIILTPEELREAVASNPYPEAESAPTTLHLTFLSSVPEHPDLVKLERLRQAGERFTLRGRTFYFHAPNGVGRSKLFASIERALGVPGTARNWRTVCRLLEMVDQ
ncbi:protein of unknown function DUF1697 [Thermobaculum terrenum ATCC BAA-798]|uniref:DUF1697 domain-containing protein n=1 Tax=Thermobaculum terrenum (strain ATCC BAA-798 / CCMEE 7001 / YNP1) TaxID=525904 RepID=D1CIT7_THET1|nr:protein of unknown function DUF1697 [Thermobaculum terrenum ATCC BAA-798]